MKYYFGVIIGLCIVIILFITRCDNTCQMTKQITENLKQAQEQQDIYSGHVDKAGEYYKKYQEEIKQASKAKVSQWKHEKTASNIYGSGVAFGNYAYAGWDEGLKEKVTPQILKDFYLEDCRITQEEDHHIKEGRGSMYATDIACEQGKSFDVKAPSVNDSYLLVKKGYDQKLGNYIILNFDLTNILFAHTTTSLKEGDKVNEGAIIGNTDLSGISQNHHVHIEVWRNNQGVWQNIKYPSRWWYGSGYDDVVINEKSEEILEQRKTGYLGKYTLTRYYSPAVGQTKYYVDRKYDINMNCGGTQEEGCKYPADGKLLTDTDIGVSYACPKTMKLGQKIKLVFERGTVHGTCRDRGGAIKGKRLDAWCGYGDEGVNNILNGTGCYTGEADIYIE